MYKKRNGRNSESNPKKKKKLTHEPAKNNASKKYELTNIKDLILYEKRYLKKFEINLKWKKNSKF